MKYRVVRFIGECSEEEEYEVDTLEELIELRHFLFQMEPKFSYEELGSDLMSALETLNEPDDIKH